MTRLAATALLLAAASPAAAGPWARAAGEVYAQVSWETLATTELATPDGNVVEIPEYAKDEFRLYAEVGLGRGLTAIADVPLHIEQSIDQFGSAGGFGDLRAGLQATVARSGDWRFAVRGILQFPTGDETKGLTLLPTGSGAFEGEVLFSAGTSLGGGRGYLFAEAGWDGRANGLHDGFLYQGEIGVTPVAPLTLAFRVYGLEPFGDPSGEVQADSASGLGDGVTYTRFGPSATVAIGGGFAVDGRVEWLRNAANIARGTSYRLAVSYRH